MASSFFGIEIAKTGLFMSQKHLNLTGHNISNATTPGYSRQRIITQSIDPNGVMVRWSPTDKGRVGGGVRLQTLERVRDQFIDRELRREYCKGGELAMKEDALLYVESIFNETNSASLSNALKDMFNSFHELSKNTASQALRTDVKTKATTFTETLHMYYDKLVAQQVSLDENMKETVNRINDILKMTSDYNEQIFRYEITGENANDLRDKRDLLLDELATLIDIKYEETNGELTISNLNGDVLLQHADYVTFSTAAGTPPFCKVQITTFGNTPTTSDYVYSSGELEGYRRIRDGATANDYGIPYILEQLNTLAKGLHDVLNAQHNDGWTIPHDGIASTDGVDLFELAAGVPAAKGLNLSAAVAGDIWKIACSDTEILDPADAGQKGNNKNMLEILKLISNEYDGAINNTSFEGYLKSVVTEIGSQSSKVQTLNATQLSVLLNLESKREAVSGVSIDEEITLMLQFQRMYQANSRMITALDEALDILINRTGVVGR